MNKFETIYKRLSKVVDLEALAAGKTLVSKVENSPWMDLHFDLIAKSDDGKTVVIALAHRGVQNGDSMADPDMEVRIFFDAKMAEALTYQNDYVGVRQEVYGVNREGRAVVYPKLKTDLNAFLATWLKNLIDQGFKVGVTPGVQS